MSISSCDQRSSVGNTVLLDLTVVIVSWNTKDLLRACLRSLQPELSGLSAEVFLVDNDSKDGSAQMVASEFSWVRLIANKSNLGFAAANNQAFALAQGKHILLLNPDTVVCPGAVSTLLTFLHDNPDAGAIAPQLLNTDGSIQRSCRQFPTFLNMAYELFGLSKLFPRSERFRKYKMLDFDHATLRQVDQPEGACLLVRSEILQQIGYLDDQFFMLFEEVDWLYRMKQMGWQIWFVPEAKVVHHYGQSIKQVKAKMIWSSHKGMYRYWCKHHSQGLSLLKAPVFAALMALALFRIVIHSIKGSASTQAAKVS